MPNECYMNITVGAEPEVIQMLVDSEFRFEKLRPHPDTPAPENYDEYWYKWNCENWGTKWDRSEYNILNRGKKGLIVEFITAWCPPIELLKHIIRKYKMWVKCEWREEGGLAGIFVGENNGEKVIDREFTWEDWCLEEDVMRMTP